MTLLRYALAVLSRQGKSTPRLDLQIGKLPELLIMVYQIMIMLIQVCYQSLSITFIATTTGKSEVIWQMQPSTA